ncbi:Class V chitinase, partial [Bienertia sinuspersici]
FYISNAQMQSKVAIGFQAVLYKTLQTLIRIFSPICFAPLLNSTLKPTNSQFLQNAPLFLKLGGAVLSSIFNAMAGQPSSKKTFTDSSINLALTNKFDGLYFDWEHQTMEVEMNNLKDLLNEWKTAIKSQAPNLLVTAALNVKPQIGFNVMAYDFIYDPNQPPTSTRAPAALNNPNADLSGSSGISAWINLGVPANKLVTC